MRSQQAPQYPATALVSPQGAVPRGWSPASLVDCSTADYGQSPTSGLAISVGVFPGATWARVFALPLWTWAQGLGRINHRRGARKNSGLTTPRNPICASPTALHLIGDAGSFTSLVFGSGESAGRNPLGVSPQDPVTDHSRPLGRRRDSSGRLHRRQAKLPGLVQLFFRPASRRGA